MAYKCTFIIKHMQFCWPKHWLLAAFHVYVHIRTLDFNSTDILAITCQVRVQHVRNSRQHYATLEFHAL